jgi:predicted RNA-binding protein with PUA-like domain
VGPALVVRAAYPDPKSKDPRSVVVDLTPAGRLPRPVTLAEIRQLPAFADSPLLRQGRLSVVPLTKEQWNALTKKTTE